MANTGFGLRLVGRIGGGAPRVRTYNIPATDATVYGEGDVVMLPATGAMDSTGQYINVTAFVSGDVPIGVIQGFRPIASQPYVACRPASTQCLVNVCDDPDAIYEVQEDAVTSVVSAAHVAAMYNAPLTIVATTTTNGFSGTMLTSNSATTSISDVKIIGVRQDASNAAGTATVGAILQVRLLGPVQPGSALTSTVSHN